MKNVQSKFERESSGTPALAATLMGDGIRQGGNGNSGATPRGEEEKKN